MQEYRTDLSAFGAGYEAECCELNYHFPGVVLCGKTADLCRGRWIQSLVLSHVAVPDHTTSPAEKNFGRAVIHTADHILV